MPRIRRLVTGLVSACPLILVSCCAQKKPEIEYVRVTPPPGILSPCEYPEFKIETNRDLVVALSLVIEAYTLCEAKVDTMIRIYQGEDQ